MIYNKPALTTFEHIEQLRQRGLIIDDDDRVTQHLTSIGYYRLSAYCVPFYEVTRADALAADSTDGAHNFKANTRFDDVLNLYVFDRKLRLLIIEAIERIEVAVRAQWANQLSVAHQDPHAYMNTALFKSPWKHQKNLAKITSDIKDSNEKFIGHYLKKYQQPFLPPIWVVAETMSFGALSHWYANTKDNHVKAHIAKSLGLPTVDIMERVLHCLTLVRNTAAHHNRVWNRKFSMQPPYIKKLSRRLLVTRSVNPEGHPEMQPNREIYNYLIIMGHMMNTLQPSSDWCARLAALIALQASWQQHAMGFRSEQWQDDPFWQSPRQDANHAKANPLADPLGGDV